MWFLSAGIIVALTTIGCNTGVHPAGQTEPQDSDPMAVAPEDHQAVSDSVKENVAAESDRHVAEKRKEIAGEAVAALSLTRKALNALEEKNVDVAQTALEKATGKLELLLSRQPDLALAPTDVVVSTRDVLTTIESIEKTKDQAEEALEDGNVQLARALLGRLASEIAIHVTNIPLLTYPDAIKKVSPLIDEGRIDEARATLAAALNTLVVTEHVIPLPFFRASAMLADAEDLSTKENRNEEENRKLSSLVENARYQLEMAEALGYGKKEDHEQFHEQLDQIERETQGGKSGKGFFDEIKSSIAKMVESLTR
jgi:hypothetical protein